MRVAGDLPVVPEPAQGLEERVADTQAASERVDEGIGAARSRSADAERRAVLVHGQRPLRDPEVVGRGVRRRFRGRRGGLGSRRRATGGLRWWWRLRLLLLLLEQTAEARDRRQRTARRDAGDPRRPATAEREVVLPGEKATAIDGGGYQAVEQLAQLVDLARRAW